MPPVASPLSACLAHAVLEDRNDWLGRPSPRSLQTLLLGAFQRAALVEPSFPSWRIDGPLGAPAFWKPIVARTGRPTLSIKWADALELIYFSNDEALYELSRLMVEFDEATVDTGQTVGSPRAYGVDQFWSDLRRRPGMFMPSGTGQALHDFLIGLDRGGDWLGLPELPGLRHVIDAIESESAEAYGSRFGAYRVYECDGAQTLLGWALDESSIV